MKSCTLQPLMTILLVCIIDLATTSYITEHVKIKKANKAKYCKNNKPRHLFINKVKHNLKCVSALI